MDDRFLFRGRRLDNGEWVEGDLVQLNDGRRFIVNHKHGACIDASGNFINTEAPFVNEVDPSTIGQCTGLKDKNGRGKLAFESDVIRIFNDIYSDKNFYDTVIFWNNERFRFMFKNPYGIDESLDELKHMNWEIIGNIHENPDLLIGKGD